MALIRGLPGLFLPVLTMSLVLWAASAVPLDVTTLGWAQITVRVVRDAAAALAIGLLLVTATALPTRPGDHGGQLSSIGRRGSRMAAAAAVLWASASVVAAVLGYRESAAGAFASPGSPIYVVVQATASGPGARLVLGSALAAAAAVLAARASSTGAVASALTVAVGGVIPVAATAHGAVIPALAATVQVGHVLAASAWIGGLGGLLLLHRYLAEAFGVVVRRYSTIAGWSFAVVLVSGALGAALRLERWSDFLTPYGGLLLAKIVALLLLGAAGWSQRTRILAHVDPARARSAFTRLAVLELLVMGAAVALAAALSRTVPPGSGFPAPSSLTPTVHLLPVPGARAWAMQWDLAPIWVMAAVVGIGLYARAAFTVRRRGARWSVAATAAWTAGWLLLVVVTGGAPAVYGRTVLAMHVLAHVTMAIAVPVLWVLGRPVDLLRKALPARHDGTRGPREWIDAALSRPEVRLARRPVVALPLYGTVLSVVMFSPLLSPEATGAPLRTGVGVSVALVGVILAASLHQRVTDPTASLTALVTLLGAVVGLHGLIGVAVMTRTDIAGGRWVPAASPSWSLDRAADQQLAGELVWAVGAVAVTALALVALSAGTMTGASQRRSRTPASEPTSVFDQGAGAGVSRRSVLVLGAAGTVGAFTTAGALITVNGGGPARVLARVGPVDAPVDRVEAMRRLRGTGRRVHVQLTASPVELDIGGRVVQAWGYGGASDAVRCSAGDLLSVDVTNQLPETTTVHWHGLQLRNDMDGVPYLTQDPIAPGGRQRYEFTASDPGTYWFHPHVGMQRDRGLFAPLIVEDPSDHGAYDAEFIVVLDDWIDDLARPEDLLSRLAAGQPSSRHTTPVLAGAVDSAGQEWQYDVPPRLAEGPAGHEPLSVRLAGEVGYAFHLLNGRLPTAPRTFTARPGHRARLRIINAAGTSTYRLALGGHQLSVTHSDGFPVEPVTVDTLQIAPGERYDAIVRLGDGAFPLVAVAEGQGAQALGVVRTGSGAPPAPDVQPRELAGRLLRLDDLRAARSADLGTGAANVEHDLYLTGSMDSLGWHINAERYDHHRPFRAITPLPMQHGDRVRLRMVNQTPMYHPMHVHGHTFQVSAAGRYDRPPRTVHRGPRKDTVLVPPGQRIDVDLLADNPGQWLTHCHNSVHMATGMATVLSYVHRAR